MQSICILDSFESRMKKLYLFRIYFRILIEHCSKFELQITKFRMDLDLQKVKGKYN